MYEFVSPLHSGQDVGEATAGGDATGDDRQGGTQ
jgi:hypothetical protein